MRQFIRPDDLPLRQESKLKQENRALQKQVFQLSTIERERDLALEEAHHRGEIINRLDALCKQQREEIWRIQHTCKLAVPDAWKIMIIVFPWYSERAAKREAPRPDGMVHVYMYELSRDVGKERHQTGQTLIKMAEAGLISRDAKVYVTANGERGTDVYISIPPIIQADTFKPNPTNWGNHDRFTCPNCKHQLLKTISYHCNNCNLDFDEHGCFVEPDQKEVS